MRHPPVVPALVLCLATLAAEARAEAGECILQVGGRSMIDGACTITDLDDAGSLEIVSSDGAYVAQVITKGGGVGKAFWNGGGGSTTKTDVVIGTVVLDGACWASDKTKICATR
ncbi:MAG TPA: hypothetical protein PKA03_18025 [Tabrizicola sp.]|nr:hypothetical protein [Tabrizicola sp.]